MLAKMAGSECQVGSVLAAKGTHDFVDAVTTFGTILPDQQQSEDDASYASDDRIIAGNLCRRSVRIPIRVHALNGEKGDIGVKHDGSLYITRQL